MGKELTDFDYRKLIQERINEIIKIKFDGNIAEFMKSVGVLRGNVRFWQDGTVSPNGYSIYRIVTKLKLNYENFTNPEKRKIKQWEI